MRIVIAPDSFKESLSASKVAHAISDGIKRIDPETEIVSVPMADGGEGTVEALVTATSGKIISVPSVDALNRPISSFFGVPTSKMQIQSFLRFNSRSKVLFFSCCGDFLSNINQLLVLVWFFLHLATSKSGCTICPKRINRQS